MSVVVPSRPAGVEELDQLVDQFMNLMNLWEKLGNDQCSAIATWFCIDHLFSPERFFEAKLPKEVEHIESYMNSLKGRHGMSEHLKAIDLLQEYVDEAADDLDDHLKSLSN